MPPPSFLEQSFIMKGDTLNFISGVSKNGFPYGVRVMDFVLRKMLDNDKYSEVIGVSLVIIIITILIQTCLLSFLRLSCLFY